MQKYYVFASDTWECLGCELAHSDKQALDRHLAHRTCQ